MRYINIFLIFIFCFQLHAVVQESASLKDFLYGETDQTAYDNFQSHIIEGVDHNINDHAPYDPHTDGFGTFTVPTDTDTLNWAQLIQFFLDENLQSADSLIQELNLPYEIVEFNDTDVNRNYIMLRELVDTTYVDTNSTDGYIERGSFNKGWGLYIYNPNSFYDNIITTPHPSDDFITIPVSCYAFQELNAKYWLISNVSREAAHSGTNFTNGTSLSDPTRNSCHPYNTTYKAIANKVRQETGEREFCVQIHSYDWDNTGPHRPIELSMGPFNDKTSLPTRDFSSQHRDLVNFTDEIVVPANSVGIHDQIRVEDYYCINNGTEPIYFYGENQDYAIDNQIWLEGYHYNVQMRYTNDNYNDYEVFDPFFHIEMHELPYVYATNDSTYRWFYEQTGPSFKSRFDKMFVFYAPWVDALDEAMRYYNRRNDYQTPDAPQLTQLSTLPEISWTRADCYDFATYRIFYSDSTITDPPDSTVSYIDRNSMETLAQPTFNSYTDEVVSLIGKYVRVQTVDQNGHESDLSNEIIVVSSNVNISQFSITPGDNGVTVSWTTTSQTNNSGFLLKRTEYPFDQTQTLFSYVSDLAMLGYNQAGTRNYSVTDNSVVDGGIYKYSLYSHNSQLNADVPLYLNQELNIVPYYNLVLDRNGVTEESTFGMNFFASDGYSDDFDETTSLYNRSQYVVFTSPPMPRSYETMIHEAFDPNEVWKEWPVKIKNQSGENGEVYMDPLPASMHQGGRLFMTDGTNCINLLTDTLAVPNGISGDYYTMYWGNIQPNISQNMDITKYYHAGDTLTLNWSSDREYMIKKHYLTVMDHSGTQTLVDSIYSTTNSYEIIPDGTYSDSVFFTLHTILYDDDEISIDFPVIHVYNNTQSYALEEGIQLLNVHNLNSNININTMLSDLVHFYSYDDSSFTQHITMTSGTYAVESDQTYQFSEQTPAYPNSTNSVLLSQGWNLIGSPFPHDYPLSAVKIIQNNQETTYNQAVLDGIIEGYGLDNSGFITEERVIENGKSLWIYSFEDSLEMEFTTYPVRDSLEFQYPEYQFVNVVVSDMTEENQDLFTTGHYEYGFEEFDIGLDRMCPPDNFKQIKAYTYDDDYCYFRNLKPYIIDINLDTEYNLRIHSPAGDSVKLFIDDANYRVEYSFYVFVNGQQRRLRYGQDLVLYNETGTLDLIFKIQDYVTSNDVNTYEFVPLANYPNPFNPETTLNFSIHKPEHVELKVYNLKGQLVKTLVDEKMEAGIHKVVWKGRNNKDRQVASGVYFVKLKASTNNDIRKMILLK